MNCEDIELLYQYDRWANGRVLGAAAALSEEKFTRDLGGSFKSVRDTLIHIFGGEWIWLNYWNEPAPTFAFLAELRTRRESLFAPAGLPDIAAVQRKWEEVEKAQIAFLKSVTDESLLHLLPFRTTEVPAHLMQHMANHSTYHRGQVSLMMRQLGAEPAATDFHVFLLEGR